MGAGSSELGKLTQSHKTLEIGQFGLVLCQEMLKILMAVSDSVAFDNAFSKFENF